MSVFYVQNSTALTRDITESFKWYFFPKVVSTMFIMLSLYTRKKIIITISYNY
jgi:hypothetical protein